MATLLSRRSSAPDLTNISSASPKNQSKKQVRFSPKSLMHQFPKLIDNKTLCHTKKDRHSFQVQALKTARSVRRSLRKNDVPMETDLVYLHLKSSSGYRGIEPEDMIGIEHLIENNQNSHEHGREVARAVVAEWRRSCSNCDPSEEDDGSSQVAALAEKLSKDSAIKARRRAEYVRWMNELPADIKLSDSQY